MATRSEKPQGRDPFVQPYLDKEYMVLGDCRSGQVPARHRIYISTRERLRLDNHQVPLEELYTRQQLHSMGHTGCSLVAGLFTGRLIYLSSRVAWTNTLCTLPISLLHREDQPKLILVLHGDFGTLNFLKGMFDKKFPR